MTTAARQRRWRQKKADAAKDPVKTFLQAVLRLTATDAATVGAQDTAETLLDKLIAAETSEVSKLAPLFGVKAPVRSTEASGTEAGRNQRLRLLTAKVKDQTATPSDIRVGLRMCSRAVRAERAPVNVDALRTRMAMVLSGLDGMQERGHSGPPVGGDVCRCSSGNPIGTPYGEGLGQPHTWGDHPGWHEIVIGTDGDDDDDLTSPATAEDL